MAERPLQKITRSIERKGTAGTLRKQDPTPSNPLSASDLNSLERKARSMKTSEGTMTSAGLKLFHKVQAAKRYAEARRK